MHLAFCSCPFNFFFCCNWIIYPQESTALHQWVIYPGCHMLDSLIPHIQLISLCLQTMNSFHSSNDKFAQKWHQQLYLDRDYEALDLIFCLSIIQPLMACSSKYFTQNSRICSPLQYSVVLYFSPTFSTLVFDLFSFLSYPGPLKRSELCLFLGFWPLQFYPNLRY